jgi:hypothetical protein
MAEDKQSSDSILGKKITELSISELQSLVDFLDSRELKNPDPIKMAKLKVIHRYLKIKLGSLN